MLQRCAQLFSRLGLRSDLLVGQGLPERMRTATVALLGVTAAVSMAFVAVIAQQGWTVLSLGPIPTPFVGPQAVGDGAAVSTGGGGPPTSAGAHSGFVAAVGLTAGSQGAQPGRAHAQQPPAGTVGGSHPLAHETPAGEAPTAPPSGGEESPAAPAPGPSAGPSPTPPSSGESGKGTAATPPAEPGTGKSAEKEKTSSKGSEKEKSKSEASAPAAPPPAAKPEKPKEEKNKEEAPPESPSHGHGHGHGHHHW